MHPQLSLNALAINDILELQNITMHSILCYNIGHNISDAMILFSICTQVMSEQVLY
jgi:hypothetical protein